MNLDTIVEEEKIEIIETTTILRETEIKEITAAGEENNSRKNALYTAVTNEVTANQNQITKRATTIRTIIPHLNARSIGI